MSATSIATMSMTTPTPQAQPPLQADGDANEDPTQTPPYSLSHHTASASAATGPMNLPPSPIQLILADGGFGSDGGGADDGSETLTNFMKYGTIRPPLSVLQDEFLEKYRSWREHAEPLEGIDGLVGSREQSGDEWTGHMASIQKMYARHHNRSIPLGRDRNQHRDGARSDLFEPRSDLLDRGEAVCEQKFEDEKPIAAEKEDDVRVDDIDASRSQEGDCERKQLEALAALMFRPGSKLSGTIGIQDETARSDYELVVMEGDSTDELGQPKGLLAHHKFAGDEQCIFVKLFFVTIDSTQEKEKESIEDEVKSQEDEKNGQDECRVGDTVSETPSEKKITIQIEYVDGDNVMNGLWNRDKLCFEGTVMKLTEDQAEQNQLGGTIISGLISGHSSGESSSGGRIVLRRPTCSGTRTFSLSPCTHLHPRGVAPAPPCHALSAALSRLLGTIPETSGSTSIALGQDAAVAAASLKAKKRKALTPEKRMVLLDEIASLDNYKITLHRARTETLRRETLKELVELGSVIDFAELARKRDVAKRREKWRLRMRKYTPHLPRRMLRRGRTSRTGGDNYDISKDNVQAKKIHFYDQLAAISWGDLLEEASIQAEKTCAIFRRQTALLDNLTFESDEYKAQVMVDLRTNGLTLAGSHSEWDQCIQMGRAVALGWSWFERGSWSCFERSAVVGKRCVYLLFQMHSRLEANHKHLEKSFRGADARLTHMQLERIKKGSHAMIKPNSKEAGGGGECEYDGLCGICQCGLDEDEGENGNTDNPAVCLPCSHCFHWECIREWLHNHSQCPICRVDLNAS